MKRNRKILRSKKRYNKFLKRNELIEIMELFEKSFIEFAAESVKSISRIKISDILPPDRDYLIGLDGQLKWEPRHITSMPEIANEKK